MLVITAVKTAWPELVGVNYKKAMAVIRKDNPYVLVSAGQYRLEIVCCNAVVVLFDQNTGLVVAVPKIG